MELIHSHHDLVSRNWAAGRLLAALLVMLWHLPLTIAHGATWYVDQDAVEGGDGMSWASAYREIQPAIDAAHADGGGEVWVAEGVYNEERPENGGSLAMREGVHLYGGFAGLELLRNERDLALQVTTITGTRSWGDTEKGLIVLVASRSTLDGFHVESQRAGRLSLDHLTLSTVRNCSFLGGQGYASMINVSGGSYISIEDCHFIDNPYWSIHSVGVLNLVVSRCEFTNGGFPTYVDSEALFEDCTFSNSTQGAVLLYGAEGTTTFRGCIFKENRGKVRGTAVYIDGRNSYEHHPALFANCVFAFNGPNDTPPEEQMDFYSTVYLDAFYDYKSLATPKRRAARGAPTIADSAEGEGEGDDYYNPGPFYDVEEPSFINCTFYGNRVKYGGALYYAKDFDVSVTHVNAQITNCIFKDNGNDPVHGVGAPITYSYADATYPGTGNLSGPIPCFMDPDNGDLRLLPYSLAVDSGRDTSAPEFGGLTTDILGCPRGYDGEDSIASGDGSNYDMGAYEYVPGCNVSAEGEGEGEGEGQPPPAEHTADQNDNGIIEMSELLRVIQLFNVGAFHCADVSNPTEDDYAPGTGDTGCAPHSSDYNPQDWRIDLNELLRLIQFYNVGGYVPCPEANTEDGFCPGSVGK